MEKVEIWKDIPGYEGLYKVSDAGRVHSLTRYNSRGCLRKGKIMRPRNSDGYSRLQLFKDGKDKYLNIHQLVAMAFLGHVVNGRTLVVNHINFNKSDNRVENLEIVTTRENSNRKHLKSSSKYTGVCWNKRLRKWTAAMHLDGTTKYLGVFTDELEASQAYQAKLKEL